MNKFIYLNYRIKKAEMEQATAPVAQPPAQPAGPNRYNQGSLPAEANEQQQFAMNSFNKQVGYANQAHADLKNMLTDRRQNPNDAKWQNTMKDKIMHSPVAGLHLAQGYNGLNSDGTAADATWKSRGRQALAVGSIAGGTALGGYGGNRAANWLSKKLGLQGKNTSGFGKFLNGALVGAGTLGGAALGGVGGAGLAGMMSGKGMSQGSRELQGQTGLLNTELGMAQNRIEDMKAEGINTEGTNVVNQINNDYDVTGRFAKNMDIASV